MDCESQFNDNTRNEHDISDVYEFCSGSCKVCDPVNGVYDKIESISDRNKFTYPHHDHWTKRTCVACGGPDGWRCTCPLCIESLLTSIFWKMRKEKYISNQIIAISETNSRIVEIQLDTEGYLCVSAYCKPDSFTGETVFVLNMKEAVEEFMRLSCLTPT